MALTGMLLYPLTLMTVLQIVEVPNIPNPLTPAHYLELQATIHPTFEDSDYGLSQYIDVVLLCTVKSVTILSLAKLSSIQQLFFTINMPEM